MANIHRGYNILVCEVCTVYCLYTLQCDSVKRGQYYYAKLEDFFAQIVPIKLFSVGEGQVYFLCNILS